MVHREFSGHEIRLRVRARWLVAYIECRDYRRFFFFGSSWLCGGLPLSRSVVVAAQDLRFQNRTLRPDSSYVKELT